MELIYCLYSLVKCLEYLEEKNIMHNNIKPTNILFDENECVYLSDGKMQILRNGEFSTSSRRTDDALFYAEPLILVNQKDNYIGKRDAWSLGIVMLEFCLREINIKSSYSSIEEIRNMVQCYIERISTAKTLLELLLDC